MKTCIIGKRGAGKDTFIAGLGEDSISICDILQAHCKLHHIPQVRESYIQLGNTTFDGEKMAETLLAMSGPTCHINGIRKPSTLAHILQKHRAVIAAVVSDDTTRRERVTRRARHSDTPLSYVEFLADEHKENSYPNKQNIDLLLAFADVHIPNTSSKTSLINHGNNALTEALWHIDHQPASTTHIDALGYRHFARGIIHNEHNEILLVYDHAKARYLLPGGKCDAGETPDITIARELHEELGVPLDIVHTYQGSVMGLYHDGLGKGHFFTSTCAQALITNKEPEKQTELRWIPIDRLSEVLGYRTMVDSGLEQHITQKRAPLTTTPIHRDISSNTPACKPQETYIQYIDATTGYIYIQPYHAEDKTVYLTSPHLLPMRIVSGKEIQSGYRSYETYIISLFSQESFHEITDDTIDLRLP